MIDAESTHRRLWTCRWCSCTLVWTKSAMWSGRQTLSTSFVVFLRKLWSRCGLSLSLNGLARLTMDPSVYVMRGKFLDYIALEVLSIRSLCNCRHFTLPGVLRTCAELMK
jgi:hypothetical protein